MPPRAKSWRDHAHKPAYSLFWYRSTKFVLRHALPVGLAVVALLLLLGIPFLGVKWGFPDERVLPRSASARQVADMLDNDFANGFGTSISVVVPDARGVTPADLERYAAELSRVPDVSAVTAPTGTFVAGSPAGPPAAATGMANGSAFLTVATTAPLYSQASNTQLDRLHSVGRPGGRSVEMTGLAQINRDSVSAITRRLPAVLALIAVITFTLLFLLTGSAVLPLQALVCNVLSLTAAFGAMVWIFQNGHLGAFGTTPNGTLNANIPVLLFCIAFGLAMDYEVFLVSRIHEYWLASPARPGAATERRRGACRHGREHGAGSGRHRPGRHHRRPGDVDFVRRLDPRPRVVHANARPRPDACRAGRRHPRADGPGSGLHPPAWPVDVVGAQTVGSAA